MNQESASRLKAKLVAINGDFSGMEYELVADETLIGRNPTTDITLLDDGISREHALILYEASERVYVIEDLQSTNGTKVNGKRVRSATLHADDEIRIGNTRFTFSIGSDDSA